VTAGCQAQLQVGLDLAAPVENVQFDVSQVAKAGDMRFTFIFIVLEAVLIKIAPDIFVIPIAVDKLAALRALAPAVRVRRLAR
jgi:hypothetical protein